MKLFPFVTRLFVSTLIIFCAFHSYAQVNDQCVGSINIPGGTYPVFKAIMPDITAATITGHHPQLHVNLLYQEVSGIHLPTTNDQRTTTNNQ